MASNFSSPIIHRGIPIVYEVNEYEQYLDYQYYVSLYPSSSIAYPMAIAPFSPTRTTSITN